MQNNVSKSKPIYKDFLYFLYLKSCNENFVAGVQDTQQNTLVQAETFHISLGFQYSKPNFISTGSPGTDSTYLILLFAVSIYNAQAVQHLSSTLACGINLL